MAQFQFHGELFDLRIQGYSGSQLTRIRLQVAIYFCRHRGKFARKHGKLASSLATTKVE
jgi:hypothetical protein